MKNLGLLLKNNFITTFNFYKLKKENPVKLIAYLILILYVVFSLFTSFTGYAKIVAESLEKYNLMAFMLILFFIMATFMIFNFSIYDAKSNLFNAKDNDLLLSLPINTKTILASRILRMVIWNLLLSLIIIIPAIYIYTSMVNISYNFFIIILIAFIFLPIIPTILASLIGYFIAYLTSKVNFKNYLEIILSFIFVGLIYYLMSNGQNLLSLFLNNQETMMNILKYLFYPIYLIYQTFTSNDYLALLGYVLINLGLLILFVSVLNKNYKKIINKLQENNSKSNFVMKRVKVNSPVKALFYKEIKRYFSSPIYVLNTSFGVLLLLIISIATIFYDTDQILTLLDINVTGVSIFELIMFLIVFVIFMSSTTSASISLEGKSFWISKSIPVDSIKILDSKILFNLVLVLPFVLISIIIFKFTLSLSLFKILLLFIISIIMELVASHFGLLINLKFPKMDAISDVVIVKRSVSVMVSLMVPLVIIFGLGGIYTELIKTINFNTIFMILMILMLIILLIERITLIKWGRKKFYNIN